MRIPGVLMRTSNLLIALRSHYRYSPEFDQNIIHSILICTSWLFGPQVAAPFAERIRSRTGYLYRA